MVADIHKMLRARGRTTGLNACGFVCLLHLPCGPAERQCCGKGEWQGDVHSRVGTQQHHVQARDKLWRASPKRVRFFCRALHKKAKRTAAQTGKNGSVDARFYKR